ncbi:MAG: hypothetical protein NXI12_09580 [Alphaproteobacteria bacterium]|nr:hypothetical protein [Alphaproteobacteria bacterium]
MSASETQRRGPPWLTLLALAVVVGAAAVVIVFSRPAPPLERSAIGYEGLARWLAADGLDVDVFTGAGPLASEDVGVRILALFDADPTQFEIFEPGSAFDPDLHAVIRPQDAGTVVSKVAGLPTVIVFPKWRDGVRRRGVRHEELLINAGAGEPGVELEAGPRVTDILRTTDRIGEDVDLDPDGPDDGLEKDSAGAEPEADRELGPLIWPRVLPVNGDVRRVEEISAPNRLGGRVRLAAPQYAQAGPACEPLVGDAVLGLVFACLWEGTPFWVVSDPDLLNTHGLTDPANRAFASAFVRQVLGEAGGGSVLIDYSNHNWVVDGEPRGRSLSDLARYFQPPFVWLWLAAALLFAAAFWRGAVREQPLASVFRHGHGAARRIAFLAQARLMRATGRDGALLRALAGARAAALCDLMLGRDERGGARTERMLAQLTRRDAVLGERLAALLAAIADLPDRLPLHEAEQALNDLETLYQEARASAGAMSRL